jgi:hypothetical protein
MYTDLHVGMGAAYDYTWLGGFPANVSFSFPRTEFPKGCGSRRVTMWTLLGSNWEAFVSLSTQAWSLGWTVILLPGLLSWPCQQGCRGEDRLMGVSG